MSRDVVEIYRAATPLQAQQLIAFLDAEGIDAYPSNVGLQGAAGDVPFGWATSPVVVVAEDDEKRARAFAAEFDRMLREGRGPDFGETAEQITAWREWPACPQCRTRRMTACPVCGEAGDNFAKTDYDERGAEVNPSRRDVPLHEVDSNRPLIECPMCEERFRPEFYRRCAHCGHDFGEGIDLDEKSNREPLRWDTMVLFGFIAFCLITIGWLLGRLDTFRPR